MVRVERNGELEDQMRCGTCRFYEESDTSIFGGWCLLGAHLQEKKNVVYGVDKDDGCRDWEDKNGKTEV